MIHFWTFLFLSWQIDLVDEPWTMKLFFNMNFDMNYHKAVFKWPNAKMEKFLNWESSRVEPKFNEKCQRKFDLFSVRFLKAACSLVDFWKLTKSFNMVYIAIVELTIN